MATIFMDGFDHYGQGSASIAAMLEGVYAVINNGTGAGCGTAPFGARTGLAFGNPDKNTIKSQECLRFVLPAGQTEFWASFGFGMNALPEENNGVFPIDFRDGSNNSIAAVGVQTTGALTIFEGLYGSATLIASTAGPVLTAGVWYQFNVLYNDGTITVYINGTEALTGTVSGATCAQISLLNNPGLVFGEGNVLWMDDLYLNDTTTDFNNGNPGELQVATLYPDNNVVADQGWTPNPRQLFGTGIMDNSTNTSFGQEAASGCTTGMVSELDLGAGDFTAEGWFRFGAIPAGTNYAHLLGAWYVGTVLSYELALCGPSLNSGNMVWRVSTDGSSTTNVISWPFTPVLDQWYHIAVARASGETMLFIDGVQQGPAVADGNTYFADTSHVFGIGQAGFVLDGASWFEGWVEEVRMTVGYARYTANFAPPTAEFPVGSGSDAHWSDVQLLANFDGSGPVDLSANNLPMSFNISAFCNTPNDGAAAWQVLNKSTPLDDTYIAAPILPATSVYTQTVNFTDGDAITVATKDGSAAAVYRAKNTMAQAYDFKIAANLQTSLANLAAAINAGPGSGTAYYAGTLVNNDVTAQQLPLEQIEVTADIAGTGGNALATSTTAAAGSWPGSTLSGGVGIPAASKFNVQKPPLNTTYVLSVQLMTRQYKTDSGTCETQTSITGPGTSVALGADFLPGVTPAYHWDVFDTDPDTSAQWTPTGVVGCAVGINRLE